MTAKKNDIPGNDADAPSTWEPEHLFNEGQGPGEDVGVVESLQRQTDNLRSQLARSQADFANLRKRTRDEQSRTIRYANESLVNNLLPILDDFGRALESAQGEANNNGAGEFADGMRMIQERLHKMLEREGLERIKSQGERFDPFLHEAVMSRAEEGAEPGTILEEYQAGYSFQGRLLRAAQVVVVPGAPKPKPNSPPPVEPDDTVEGADDDEFDVEMDAEIVDEKTQPTVEIDVELIEEDSAEEPPPPPVEDEPVSLADDDESTTVSPPPSETDWEMDDEVLESIEPETKG